MVDKHSHEAWAEYWWPRVYRMALAMTHNEVEAEDLAQETLFAAFRGKDQFRGASKESTWLYAILFRKYRSILRRKKPCRAVQQQRSTSVEAALRLLEPLPPQQRRGKQTHLNS